MFTFMACDMALQYNCSSPPVYTLEAVNCNFRKVIVKVTVQTHYYVHGAILSDHRKIWRLLNDQHIMHLSSAEFLLLVLLNQACYHLGWAILGLAWGWINKSHCSIDILGDKEQVSNIGSWTLIGKHTYTGSKLFTYMGSKAMHLQGSKAMHLHTKQS